MKRFSNTTSKRFGNRHKSKSLIDLEFRCECARHKHNNNIDKFNNCICELKELKKISKLII